jgi:RNA polymerase sigma-70 factor (ECF subfamily)
MNYQTLTDEQLVKSLCESKKAAFDAIYARYWKMLYAVAYGQLGSKEEAEDIVHNVFERIWNNREIQKINCLKAYLIVSVRHFSINYVKSQITYRKFQEYLIFQEIQKNFSTDDIVNYAELQRVVNDVLKKLPDKTGEVFRMSRYENKSVKEIAAHLGLTEKAVEYHLTKSLKFIKEHLDKYYNHN